MFIRFLFLLFLVPSSVEAQTRATLYAGTGHGPNNHIVLGASIVVPITPVFGGIGDLAVSAVPGACGQDWPGSFKCEYGGRLASVGAVASPLRTERIHGSVSAQAGIFSRMSSSSDPDPAAGFRGSLSFRIAGPVWIGAAAGRQWIRDRRYRELFGEYP